MTDRTSPEMQTGLILVLGDQLTTDISSLRSANRQTDTVLIAEVADETTYVPHHKKKIAFIFSSMRHHAETLRAAGWCVRYVCLDDPNNTGSICGEVIRASKELGVAGIPVKGMAMVAVEDTMRLASLDLIS